MPLLSENLLQTNGEQKITRLIVEKDQSGICLNADLGVKFRKRKLSAQRNEVNTDGYELYKLSDLSHTQDIEIILKVGADLKQVKLPEEMFKRIAIFVSNMGKTGFDCGDFVNAAYGLLTTENFSKRHSSLDLSKWDRQPFNGNIEPGDAIVLNNDKLKYKLAGSQHRHYAFIYWR